jgi:hypothetical protein
VSDSTSQTPPPEAARRRVDLRARRREIPLGVVTIGISVVVWWPAFTLGVWGEVFFEQLMTLWAASTAAFVVVLVERRPVGARLLRATLLLLPSVWVALSFVFDDSTTDLTVFLIDLIAIIAVLVGMPFSLWVLLHIAWPDLGTGSPLSQRILVAGVVTAIAVGSFVLGLNHAGFLTCEDFTISGNSEPPGCSPDVAD